MSGGGGVWLAMTVGWLRGGAETGAGTGAGTGTGTGTGTGAVSDGAVVTTAATAGVDPEVGGA